MLGVTFTFGMGANTVPRMKTVTTLISVIGDDLVEAARTVAEASTNVAWVDRPGDPAQDLMARAASLSEAWVAAQRRTAVYTLVGFDPLETVVEQWGNRLEVRVEQQLELAIGLAQDTPGPDYLFVAATTPPPAAHWYLDHLVGIAPARVIVLPPRPGRVAATLRALPYGEALPDLAKLAATARSYVPVESELSITNMIEHMFD